MANKNREKRKGLSLDQLVHLKECKEIKFHDRISKASRPVHYNEYQDFLYNRALLGLLVYSQDEITNMHWKKRKRIVKVHTKAQILINTWKQEICNILSNHLFTTIFPESPITKEFKEVFGDVTDESYINRMSFKVLKMTKSMIVDRFVEHGILPKNFYKLKLKENASGISGKREPDASAEPREHIGRRTIEVTD
jgi:hypothetical protein